MKRVSKPEWDIDNVKVTFDMKLNKKCSKKAKYTLVVDPVESLNFSICPPTLKRTMGTVPTVEIANLEQDRLDEVNITGLIKIKNDEVVVKNSKKKRRNVRRRKKSI